MIEIEKRRSVRKYKDSPVEEEKIARLLESARLAPSGDNTQPWRFVVVDDKELIARIAEVSHRQKWMSTAPLLIVCAADIRTRVKDGRHLRLAEDTGLFELKQIIRDTSIAVEHLVLEAAAQGLGTCWVAWYTQDELRPVLGIPEDKYVVAVLTVGYPDEEPKPRPRKALGEISGRNKW